MAIQIKTVISHLSFLLTIICMLTGAGFLVGNFIGERKRLDWNSPAFIFTSSSLGLWFVSEYLHNY